MKARQGVTLLESFVCSFLLACVILTVVGLFVGSARALKQSSQRAHAGEIASRQIELLRATGFDQITLGTGTIPPVTVDQITYQGEWQVEADPAYPPTVLKKLRVRIRWTSQNRPAELVRENWLSAIRG